MKIIILISIFFPSLLLADVKAGILTEPYAGYFQGEAEGTDLVEGDIKSYTYGARLGYQTDSGFNFGIDYSQGKGDYKVDGLDTFDVNSKDGGVFIGYAFPAYMKVWASYIFKHETTIKEMLAGADIEAEGEGFNVGIGIRGIPFVSVNISYQERKIDKINDADTVGSDNKVKLTLLSLSLPYNFPWKP
jgi:hypothetical protein